VTCGHRVFVIAPAKVNLCLHVGDRHADGYHNIQSLVAFTAVEDAVWLESADHFSLTVTGPFKDEVPDGEDNLVLRAARLIAERTNRSINTRILLQKLIPAAAGLGGGSADAAAVMRGLVHLWNLDLSISQLSELAMMVGADVPVCLESAPAWMEGRGERVRRIPQLPEAWLLLVNPRVAVSTADVFRTLQARSGLILNCADTSFADLRALVQYLHSTRNDLEKPASEIAPVIAEVLDEINRLPEVLLARMSGSGATCFGIFTDHAAARASMLTLKEKHPDWWMAGACLAGEGAGKPVVVQ